MHRSPVEVHEVRSTEVERTRSLWEAVALEAPAQQPLPPVDTILERLRSRLLESERAVRQARPPSSRLAVAVAASGELVGVVSARVGDSGPLGSPSLVVVDVVHVQPGLRRAGVGGVLLEDVVSFACAAGVDEVTVHVPSGAREAGRFYAQWGFAPMTVRRAAPLATLRRRIPADIATRTNAAELTQLQRLLRRRALLGTRMVRPARSATR